MKTRVLFLGSRVLGHFVLDMLMKMPEVEIVGVVCKEPAQDSWWKLDPYNLNVLPVLTHKEASELDFDLGVSINYWKIIEPEMIAKAKLGFINQHHSYMLSLRGRDMSTHAILNARKSDQWFHGTTLHYTDDGLDTGPIIATESCIITEYDTAWSLFQRTEHIAKKMLSEWIPRLVKNKVPSVQPPQGFPLHLRKDFPNRCIENTSDPITIYDQVRSMEFGNYESSYIIDKGQKKYLTVSSSAADSVYVDAKQGRVVYYKKAKVTEDKKNDKSPLEFFSLETTARLSIRLMERRDLEDLRILHNDSDTLFWLTNVQQISEMQQDNWFNSISISNSSKRYVAHIKGTNELVGMFRVDNIDFLNGNCFVGCDIVRNWRSKGFGKEFYMCMLSCIFSQWRMHRVELVTLSDNKRAIELYKKIGFSIEGYRRESIYRSGEYRDLVIMGMTHDEFKKNRTIAN